MFLYADRASARAGPCFPLLQTEVYVELSRPTKVAAFCRELDGDGLRDLARQEKLEEVFLRAQASLRQGRIGPELEADLDSLDAMVKRVEGQGLYPAASRGYAPLPMPSESTGAQWWACPTGRCAGRGRVRPGQQAAVCAATGDRLVARPLQE